MSKRKYPAYMQLPSYDGKRLPDEYFLSTPIPFQHIKKLRPEYNMGATGEREKAPIRRRAGNITKKFEAAHEGPREKVGKPKQELIYTISGNVAREVHAKHDREAARRNQAKDRQMQQYRDVKITNSRKFNARSIVPTHLREKVTPEIFARGNRKTNSRQDGQDLDTGR